MNFWLHLYRLAPSRGLRLRFLVSALTLQLKLLERSFGKPVKYSLRSSTLDVHKLLLQYGMISSAVELLNLALNLAPNAKNLQDAKRIMISDHIANATEDDVLDVEDLEFAWNSLYLSSLLKEGASTR